MKKTIFITSCHPLISRNILSTDLLYMFIQKDTDVVLIVPQNKVSYFEKTFGQKGVYVQGIELKTGKREGFMRYLSLAALNTKTLEIKRKTEMKGSGSIATHFLSNGFTHSIIRKIEGTSYTKKLFGKLFEEYKPYAIFATDIQSEIDVALLLEAKREGIKTFGMVRSWDNLTSKGLIRVIPDQLIVWNSIVRDEAIQLHDIKPNQISIVGIPHYDAYRGYDYSDKQAFFNRVGADSTKKVVLVIPIGDRYLQENNVDRDIVKILDQMLPGNYQILVRLPPGDYVRELENEGVKDAKHTIIYDRSYGDNGNIKLTELRKEDDLHLGQTLFNSDFVVSGPSTLIIDSVFMNKPVILFGFDGYKKKPYLESIGRYYDYDNFIPILKSNGVRLSTSIDEFKNHVALYLNNPKEDESGRQNLIKDEVSIIDGTSVKRLFETLIS